MKKLFSVILALVFLFSAAALSESEKELDFYGGYAHMEIWKDNTPVMYVIYFAEDHTCYYLVQSFNNDGPGVGRAHVGTWEYTPDGEVYAKTGDNTDITFHITNIAGQNIIDTKTKQVYEYFNALFK